MAYLNKPTITRLTSTSIKNPSLTRTWMMQFTTHLDGEAAASSKEYDTVPISKHLREGLPAVDPKDATASKTRTLEQLFINGHVAAWTDSETYGIYASKAIGTTGTPLDGWKALQLSASLDTSHLAATLRKEVLRLMQNGRTLASYLNEARRIVTDITTAGIKTITTDDVAAAFVDGLDPAVLKTMFTAIDNNKNDWTALEAALTKYAPA
ncbi:hypothetical protein BC829DRAFT_415337 [Chytridium lagenaria]|nr:hypothetical protein BC829DRAFT_415337 [Chytridium lagenaria]